MSEKLNEMFAANTNETTTTNNRSLAGTAQLTSLANSIAADLIKKIDADLETYKEKFEASKTDHNAMDALIKSEILLVGPEYDFLRGLSEETQTAMLKSQQSKRSRSKNKVMTLDNYRAMMSSAISELLLRQAMGKPKTTLGYRRTTGSIEYTAEELEAFKNDQDALKREIRNVQSKKSIMKSKADFDETDERWVQLLAAEDSLKSLRTGGAGVKTVVVDTTKEKLLEELGGKEVDSLKSADMKALLKKLLSGAEEPTEESEEPTEESEESTEI